MILATAGHIDHGKTALVRALTGVDADRLPEEKRRGLTIDLGFAYTTLPDGTELGFVDVPGHERFLPNMLAGVLSIDRVLLIVAADDGPRPQTLEHLDIIELIGIAEVTAVVTKIDRVPAERRAAVEAEIATLLGRGRVCRQPDLPVSSLTGEGIPALAEHLRESASAADGGARRAAGIGPVPAGDRPRLLAARHRAGGDRHRSLRRSCDRRPADASARAASSCGCAGSTPITAPVEQARAGERVALNLAGSIPEGAEPGRGDWVIDPALHKPVSRLDLAITVSRAAPAPLRDGLPVHFHLGTEDLVGRLAVLGARAIAPGDAGFVQVDFDRPIGALWGDRVIIRDHMARHTLAGGRVLDPGPPRRGRSRPERLAALAALAEPDAGDALERLLEAAGIVALAPFALARNLPQEEVEALVEAGGFRRVGAGAGAIALSPAHLAHLGDSIAAALAEWHSAQPEALGPARGALFARLRGAAPEAALDAALAELIAAGRVVRDGAVLRLPGHEPRLTREDERLWERVRPLLAAAELRPPRVRELAAALGLEPESLARFLKRVERFGRVAPVAANRFFLPETIARLADLAAALAEDSPEQCFTASLFKDRSGIGRNLTIEVLEYLDAIGVTRRVGDARIVLRRAAELSG